MGIIYTDEEGNPLSLTSIKELHEKQMETDSAYAARFRAALESQEKKVGISVRSYGRPSAEAYVCDPEFSGELTVDYQAIGGKHRGNHRTDLVAELGLNNVVAKTAHLWNQPSWPCEMPLDSESEFGEADRQELDELLDQYALAVPSTPNNIPWDEIMDESYGALPIPPRQGSRGGYYGEPRNVEARKRKRKLAKKAKRKNRR